jgi:dGTPase
MEWERLLNNDRIRATRRNHPGDARNDFESDFGRIVFSPAIRRMHDKTQVFPLTTDDNIHSRLTHSMEVMSIGYSLGIKLCENELFRQKLNKTDYEVFREIPILLKNSCLIHDIGNPPFGHFGEDIIQNYFKQFFSNCIIKETDVAFTPEDLSTGKFCLHLTKDEIKDFTEFDGNAQGLRVLTKLQILNDIQGLNLTYATLGSYIKYPNYFGLDKTIIEKHKRGVFQSEKKYFDMIVEKCGLFVNDKIIRHPLCYLMEAADSICYLTMDIEDGFNKGLYDIEYLYKKLKDIPCIKDKIKTIKEDPENYYKNDITKVVNFRITIIAQLVKLAIDNFTNNLDLIENGNYNQELILDDEGNELAETLSSICKEKIFPFRDINSLEVTGYSIMKGLFDFYIEFFFHEDKKYRNRVQTLISGSILKAAFEELNEINTENGIDEKVEKIEQMNDYYKLRVIVDFVTGMTDQFALNHYQKLSGQKIS